MKCLRATIISGFLLLPTPQALPDVLDQNAKALGIIKDFANEMCTSIPFNSESKDITITADTHAKLDGILKYLLDAGVKSAAEFRYTDSRGLLKEDLANAVRNRDSCRGHIFDVLNEKLLVNTLSSMQSFLIPPSDIVIARFDGESNELKVSREIETAIRRELKADDLASVSVNVIEKPISQDAEAQEVVKTAGAKAVIWGWRDAAQINIRVAVSSVQGKYLSNGGDVGMVDVLPRERSLALLATNLQQAAKTAALYVIGHLFYYNNDYSKGRKAFDAAMNSLPNDAAVKIENIGLVEFLKGRQSFMQHDYLAAATHYVLAIKANSKDAAAYNNLAIVFADTNNFDIFHSESKKLTKARKEFDDALRESRLFATMADLYDYPDPGPTDLPASTKLFAKARRLDPSNAFIHYNEVAYNFTNPHKSAPNVDNENVFYSSEDYESSGWKEELFDIIRADPSIPGAHVMLASISFDEGNCSESVKQYVRALELSPYAPWLHYDLGLSYFCEKRYNEARAELVSAKEYAKKQTKFDSNIGLIIDLNLANVMLKLNDPLVAIKLINSNLNLKSTKELEKDYDYAVLSAAAHFYQKGLKGFDQALRQLQVRFANPYPETDGVLPEPLDKLLLAFFLEAEGKKKEADTTLKAISPRLNKEEVHFPRVQILDSPLTLTWYDLIDKCARHGPVNEWIKEGGCLPKAPIERIQLLFDMYQDRLSLVTHYRANPYYADAACPYIYSQERGASTWRFDTAILINLRSKSLEGQQTRALKAFNGKLLVTEMEPETSFIDQIFVTVTQKDGKEIRLEVADAALKNKDGKYLILQKGQSKVVDFERSMENIVDPVDYSITAYGYYVPRKPKRTMNKRQALGSLR